ncbi:LysM peptidoglycan-binding domain-containing protein [Mesobacillus subterraneus]|uniref:LysM peptidoglycan-binding domain-containing protein n=1 Tax=Mesobacillus subterraneus TaxID=285983 RepID=UPI001CFF2AE3|nr:LysM peptidoglycan-binding domain-containing protein [Mesobacillus subterraneus]WLR56502.1 LysM peptidoglycan-binding domain-containing protein [Mesobacillus subterraneus]
MNKEKPIRDQAERLRKRVERKSEHSAEKKESLPPRSEMHRQKQKKTKVKVKYPVIRLMALFFILLPISFFSIISYLDGTKMPLNKSLERAGVEMINVESRNDGNGDDQVEDQEAPSYEEITETEEIDVVAAGPAPSSSGDKNTAESSGDSDDKEGGKLPTSASAEPEDEPADTEGTKPAGEAEPVSGEKIVYHTVKPNETLFRVAMTYYKSQEGIPIIKKANNIQGNEIQAGQVLKIPIKN